MWAMIKLAMQVLTFCPWRRIEGSDRKRRGAYHHGDLRRALVSVAGEMLGEAGVGGFRLREACRRAGVTIGAASHHFGSSRGLLTAVAADAFARLCEEFETAGSEPRPPRDAARSGPRGLHVRLARTLPGPFSVMFRWDQVDKDDVRFAELAPRSYALLQEPRTP